MSVRFWIINKLAKIIFLNPEKTLFKLLTRGLEPGIDYTIWQSRKKGDKFFSVDMIVPVYDERNIHLLHELNTGKYDCKEVKNDEQDNKQRID